MKGVASTGTPNKLLVTDLVACKDITSIPANYVRQPADRQDLAGVDLSGGSVPLIDVQGLFGDSRSEVVRNVGLACQHGGFFQVKNQGIPEAVIGGMLRVSREYIRRADEDDDAIHELQRPHRARQKRPGPPCAPRRRTDGRPVINIGDQVEVISNGRYRSALHRAVVNADAKRISVASFYCPSPDATVAPAGALVTDDRPPLCRSYRYAEYYDKFWP